MMLKPFIIFQRDEIINTYHIPQSPLEFLCNNIYHLLESRGLKGAPYLEKFSIVII